MLFKFTLLYTIFSGQTGSGKTFTMQGPMTVEGLIDYNQRGLIPRTFEYLFECIRAEEEASRQNASPEAGEREFLCKCSYVEIYNESIYDLLDMSNLGNTCVLREDIKRGVYIEGAREEVITSPAEAYEVYERGSMNRHVAETAMNRESSRSHSVFTLFIQSKQRVGEIVDVRESRFNLVDLAGSERQQATGTTGVRLKEAGNINKSLLALSNVINALVEISHGRPRHVHYRDSKLTFLLRDSLGGNSKTVIIANVSPSAAFHAETLSTLKFAQRAKLIKNKAVVNKDIQGNVLQLQAEIQRLQHELYLARDSDPSAGNSNLNAFMMDCDVPKRPRLDSSMNGLDPAEAYLMLTMALERQAECNDELESLKHRLGLLEELVRRKEAQNQSIKMILKFRENALRSDASESDQIQQLKHEISELKKIVEHHPEVTRFAYENLQLREKLYKFEGFERRVEEFETTLARHRQYEQMLTNRLLVLEKNSAEAVDEAMTASDESISMQVIDAPVSTTEKSDPSDAAIIAQLRDELQARDLRLKEMDEALGDAQARLIQMNEIETELEALQERISSRPAMVEQSTESESKVVLAQVLEAERLSMTRLRQERDSLAAQLESVQRALERERDHSQMTLHDYETAKKDFASRTAQLNDQLTVLKGEVETANQKCRSMLSERTLLAQELEVTRQVLAEFKAKEANSHEDSSAAAEAGRRIAELEADVALKTERLAVLETVNNTATALADRNKILQAENAQLSGQLSKLEFLMKSAQNDNDELMSQLHGLQAQIQAHQSQATALDAAVQLQLDAANHTIVALRAQLAELEGEVGNLRAENDKLAQHHNLKQKLQYHVKIKQENNELQEELAKCREELASVRGKQESMSQLLGELKRSAGKPGGTEKVIQMIKTIPY